MNEGTEHIAFYSPKGGVGKSSIAICVASYMYYIMDEELEFRDFDFPQYSAYNLREREVQLIKENLNWNVFASAFFKRIGKKVYPVSRCRLGDTVDVVRQNGNNKYYFYDYTGALHIDGLLQALTQMNYIVIPIVADRFVMESALEFAKMYNDNLLTTGKTRTKGLFFLWNMVDNREKTDLYSMYEQIINRLGLSVLKTILPDSKRFRKELAANKKGIGKSTFFPMDNNFLKGSNIKELAEELKEIIHEYGKR